MDTQRLILFIVFSFSLVMLWDAWQKEQRPPTPASQQAPANGAPGGAAIPTPTTPTPTTAAPSASAPTTPSVPGAGAAEAQAPRRELIRVKTDLYTVEIDPLGGDLVRLTYLRYRDPGDPDKDFSLLTPEHQYVAQSGLIGPGLPNHKTLYSVEGPPQRVLAEGEDKTTVRLTATSPDGTKVVKSLTFTRGSYLIDITQEIVNSTAAPLTAHAYFQLTRDSKAPPGDSAMVSTFTGPALFNDKDKYVKLSWSDIDKGKAHFTKEANNGWIAMVQHYFVAAIVPPADIPREFYTRKIGDNVYSAGVIVPVSVPPGGSASISVPLYAGPQDQDYLKKLAPGLDLVVDYGWLTIIAAPLFWVLKWFHGWLGNWGLAIIALTVMIKLIFYPLSAASYKSMAKMKQLAPRMTKLKEQYGDDRVKMNQAMMEMYKTEKVNPFGGCLPILVQIPVFISLYWVLLGSVELRQAPFYGWIKDLSAADPYFILPALMMVSMVIQTKMSPTPPDPVQAKVMMIMPFIFGVMFFFFPAGLVLYWLVNNILSIAQQWQISRMIGGSTPAVAKR
jgi:YidC/Oxa1 family membrane protein insertase